MKPAESPDKEISSLLLSIGLSEREARVYQALLTGGEKPAKEIAKKTGIPQPHVYSILKTLSSREIVEILPDKTKRYRALPLNQTVERLIGEKEKALLKLRSSSHEIAQRIIINGKEVQVGELKPIIGEKHIEKKAIEMIQEVKREILTITNASLVLSHNDYVPLLKNLKSRGITARVLMYFEEEKIQKMRPLIDAGIEIKFINNINVPRGLVVDGEALIEVGCGGLDMRQDIRIWTNHREIVKASRQRFEKQWENASTLEDMMKKN